MSNLPQIFNYNDSQVRTVVNESGEVWFCGKDVCQILDLKKHHDAISHLKENQRVSISTGTPGKILKEVN